MLALTDNAVMAIRDLAAQQGAPETAGLRISHDPSDDSLLVAVTDQPDQGDQVMDNLGARLFLDPQAAKLLADKALDVSVEQGNVQFAFTNRDTSGAVWPSDQTIAP
ncbi:Fe-S cluster assembly iron-binding protein IscA [Micromonospora pisi]|uniref:Fe-S cluster assembly iron-binding protein IscA n=1 Tax=Micromonospora pisi TaxID=589240 RepID=A0A495JC75_9ACTN|nr:adhesin [Micromonospora pisi]RKR86433.1 Fe-S cluster assembly iron-binding protein IscA [Micromonospora pisi]